MTGLDQAYKELRAVGRAIERMEVARSLEIYEEDWKVVLAGLEKAWNKAEQHFKTLSPKFQPWQGKYQRERKKFMYLSYLKQARHADAHSIQLMTSVMPGYVGLSAPNGGCLHIKSLRTDGNGNIIYEGSPAIIQERKPFPVAVKVLNQGVWYEPPATFEDQFGTYSSPVHLAKAGLKYYLDFLDAAKQEFGSFE